MVKNFIYLDEYKMYSLSSQIFEGITDFLINDSATGTENTENQKGPVGSGRLLADVLKAEKRITEKRYLHDYAYTVFEKHLFDQEKVLDVNKKSIEDAKSKIDNYSFIKVISRATFNDINSIKETLKNFNSIGEALAYVTNISKIEESQKQLYQLNKTIKDKNKRSVAKKKYLEDSFRWRTKERQNEKTIEEANYGNGGNMDTQS